MNRQKTNQWLQKKREEQTRAESNGDYVRVRDILKEIQDFGLEDIYNRN